MRADLTRHDGGGDVIGARLPANADDRAAAAAMLVDRAVGRWALGSFRAEMLAAIEMMLDDQRDVEPLDVCFRLAPTVLSVNIGSHLVPIPLVPANAPVREPSASTAA